MGEVLLSFISYAYIDYTGWPKNLHNWMDFTFIPNCNLELCTIVIDTECVLEI